MTDSRSDIISDNNDNTKSDYITSKSYHSNKIHDTYFGMLERQELRQFGLARFFIDYRTQDFDEAVYSSSCNIRFDSNEDAYAHWLNIGRREGYEWACGKDTVLKIILKAKDEPYLIDTWISHHAGIVGYENIIILDCGSTDPIYLQKLSSYSSRILILNYRRYYDGIHATRGNAQFFQMITKNCRYCTILDADEFLLARHDGMISAQFVKQVLLSRKLPLYCGTWLSTMTIGDNLSGPVQLDCSRQMLWSGAVAGKAIARHDVVFAIGHLGHNLHVPEVLPFLTPEAFGEVLVLHLKNLPRDIMRERIMKHLVAKGAAISTLTADIDEQISNLAKSQSVAVPIRAYAEYYLRITKEPPSPTSDYTAPTRLINAPYPQILPTLETALAEFDWSALLADGYIRLGKAQGAGLTTVDP